MIQIAEVEAVEPLTIAFCIHRETGSSKLGARARVSVIILSLPADADLAVYIWSSPAPGAEPPPEGGGGGASFAVSFFGEFGFSPFEVSWPMI